MKFVPIDDGVYASHDENSFWRVLVCVCFQQNARLSVCLSVCLSLSLSIGMFGGNAQALLQCFRYCSVLQNFKTILMFACAIRPQSSFVNTRCSITGGIVTKSQASDSDV